MPREWDTRAGTVKLSVPKLRHGSYFPSFLEHRRRSERTLASVVATSYLLGVSTRRAEKLAASLGVTSLSKSQASAMAAGLDELATGFRNRKLDGGPYTFVWIDALTQKVREGGRTVTRVPKSAQPWVSTLVRTIFEQPDAQSVRAQHAQVVEALETKLPAAAAHLDEARDAIIRLVGAVLAEQNGEWTESRRYMGTEILAECRKAAVRKSEASETEVISATELIIGEIPA